MSDDEKPKYCTVHFTGNGLKMTAQVREEKHGSKTGCSPYTILGTKGEWLDLKTIQNHLPGFEGYYASNYRQTLEV